MKLKNLRILIIIFPIIILAIIALYNGLVVREYNIKTKKADEEITIVHISDLHSHFYGENQQRIISKIAKQKPDIILLTGDIIDDKPPYDGGVVFMQKACEIAPVFYVTGNHEYCANNIKTIENLIDTTDIVKLDCEKNNINIKGVDINIYGIYDPDIDGRQAGRYDIWKENLGDLSENIDNSKYNILLSHRSVFVNEYKKHDYDLVLTGHAHGGQVRIPLLVNGLFSPDQGWFPKYAGGVYKYGSTMHIISRGVSYNPRLPRVFNPPEIVVIKLNAR